MGIETNKGDDMAGHNLSRTNGEGIKSNDKPSKPIKIVRPSVKKTRKDIRRKEKMREDKDDKRAAHIHTRPSSPVVASEEAVCM